VRDLRERNIRSKTRLLATGVLFGRGSLFYLLRNRFYIGEVKYKDEILPGEQPAIMDRKNAAARPANSRWAAKAIVAPTLPTMSSAPPRNRNRRRSQRRFRPSRLRSARRYLKKPALPIAAKNIGTRDLS
jgi:hypothetical protein